MSDGSSASSVAVRAAGLLREVERLPLEATGALLLHGPTGHCGSILIEHGRVCWIVARGLSRRLSDLLREESHALGPETLEDVFRWCGRHDTPLGEALVGSGLVTAEGLHQALRRHSAESLLSLAANGDGVDAEWVPHKHRRYDARFTFGALELWGAVGRLCAPDAANEAGAHLSRVVRQGAGAAFIVDHQDALCVATSGTDTWTIAQTQRLIDHAQLAVELADRALDGHVALASTQPGGATLLIWRHHGMFFLSLASDPGSLSLKVASISGTLALLP